MSRAAESVLPSPLPDGKSQALDALAEGLAPDALMWASGYLAGLASNGAALSAPAQAAAAATAQTLTVLYATETGNSRRVAEGVVARASAAGLSAQAVDLRDFKVSRLKKTARVVFVAATHGLGDPPDGTEDFFETLAGDRAPSLEHLEYAVLALGDSSYDDFCQIGVELDERLAALGATRFAQRIDCDVDFAADAERWTEQVVEHARARQSADAPAVTLRAVPTTPRVTRDAPYTAEVLTNQRITGRDSSKIVHHIELSLDDSGLTYEPGDALGVILDNPPEAVEPLLEVVGARGDEPVTVGDDTLPLSQALTERLDITASGRRFADYYADAADQRALRERLDHLGRDARAFFWQHQVVDLLREFPGELSPQALVDGLGAWQPRLYSIASSQDASPDEVHLTVARVAYDAFGHAHVGSASAALTNDRSSVNVYVEPNPHFRLPTDPSTPIIMIGPGTGIAPFRSFIEHRAEHGASGRNWLLFGDRTMRNDFLYQLELQRHLKRGTLDRLSVAFSRDQAQKIYVQDRLRERARDVVSWLDDGAHLYVCGDAERMAPDVHSALIDVLADVRGVSREAAEDELRQLKRDHRYQRDVY